MASPHSPGRKAVLPLLFSCLLGTKDSREHIPCWMEHLLCARRWGFHNIRGEEIFWWAMWQELKLEVGRSKGGVDWDSSRAAEEAGAGGNLPLRRKMVAWTRTTAVGPKAKSGSSPDVQGLQLGETWVYSLPPPDDIVKHVISLREVGFRTVSPHTDGRHRGECPWAPQCTASTRRPLWCLWTPNHHPRMTRHSPTSWD